MPQPEIAAITTHTAPKRHDKAEPRAAAAADTQGAAGTRVAAVTPGAPVDQGAADSKPPQARVPSGRRCEHLQSAHQDWHPNSRQGSSGFLLRSIPEAGNGRYE